jgi:hypothetical protein
MRHAFANAKHQPDGNADSHCHIHSDSNCNGDCHIHAYGNRDGDAYANSDGNGNCHTNDDGDATAAAYTNAAASPDTAATGLIGQFDLGTREATREFPVVRQKARSPTLPRRVVLKGLTFGSRRVACN